MDLSEKVAKRLSHEDYTVGWICPLEVEQVAAVEMLDEEHEQLPQPANDHNVYTLGSINGHNVVIAGLPSAGNNPAATVVTQMRNTFVELRFVLLVGIGGGVPTYTDNGPIRLGHVVVSKPVGEHSGAIQYDHGKAEAGQFRRTGSLAPPPTVLLNAAQHLAVGRARSKKDPLFEHLSRIDTTIRGLRRYKYPGADKDHLYRSDYIHPEPKVSCQKCGCDPSQRVDRSKDDSDDDDEDNGEEIVVHRGTIAAGELVMKNGLLRDKLAEQYGILCFEMEAAGALADFPCLVVRGISDYSDSHKNDKWHGYAAAAAAAYARQLFFHMPVDEVKKCRISESDVQQLIDDSNNLARDSRDERINKWLGPPDPSSNYNEALAKRHAGSGRWLLTSQFYEQWKHAPRSLLWLHGIPGCGKTILSASVLEDLRRAERPGHVVLYFFFDFKDKDKQSFDGLLRSLVSQLYEVSQRSQKYLHDAYSVHRSGNRQPSTQTLVEVLRGMIKEVRDAKIVLDALDECDERMELLPWLRSIPELGEDLHVLTTSREEEDIASSLGQWILPDNIIRLDTGTINDDIHKYVQYRVRSGPDLKRWRSRPDVQNLIETELMKKASGMFRWAACQLDALGDCLNLPRLRSSLETLPESLDETYYRILANLPKVHRKDCIRILQLIAYSKESYTVEGLADAIAVEIGCDPPFDPVNRMPEPMEITRLCSSLVSTISYSSRYSDQPVRFLVQLAHFSVKEYLTSSRVGEEFKHDLAEPNARAAIVEISLAYLSCVDYGKDSNEISRLFPFWQSGLNWMDHAVVAEASNEHLAVPISEFLSQGSRRVYHRWSRSHDLDFRQQLLSEGRSLWNVEMPPLYWPSRRGLIRSVQQLIKQGAKANDDEYEGLYSPVLAAWEGGHKNIIRFLLDHGARINRRLGRNKSPLIFAALQQHDEDFVLELLERGANPNLDIDEGWFPLHEAASQGSIKLVQGLLNKGARIEARTMGGDTALTVAVKKAHVAVIEVLLDRGADINGQECFVPDTPLVVACSEGHEAIARLLLDNGAYVNDPRCETPDALIAACKNGHKKIVKLLLERGARGSALVEAALSHHSEIVKLLLDNGADPNIKDIKGAGLLECFFRSHPPANAESIPLLLIRHGADLSDQHRKDRFLLLSCQKNYLAVVRLLLENGANMEPTTRLSRRAFYAPLRLTERETQRQGGGCDVDNSSRGEDIDGKDGGNDQRDEINESEYDFNFEDFNSYDGVIEGGNHHEDALHIASSRGFSEIVTILLDHGADPSRLDSHGWTPALLASKYGHTHVSQMVSQDRSIEGHCDSVCLPPSRFTNSMFPSIFEIIVFANHPFPGNLLRPYFEIKLKAKFGDSLGFAIDVCSEDYPDPIKGPRSSMYRRWVYLNDGSITGEEGSSSVYGPTFDIGDVIGCGVDYEANMIFYCKDKQFLGRAFDVPVGRLFPTLSLWDAKGVRMSVNFNATVSTREHRRILSS